MSDLFKRSVLPYVIFGLGVILIAMWFRKQKHEGFETITSLKKQEKVKCTKPKEPWHFDMYFVEWCSYCKQAMPEFEKLGSKLTIGDKIVECNAYEYEKIKKEHESRGLWYDELWTNFRGNSTTNPIMGYPTFRLYRPNGTFVAQYDGERNAASMKQWIIDQVSMPNFLLRLSGCAPDKEES